jgi:hypothetical protein
MDKLLLESRRLKPSCYWLEESTSKDQWTWPRRQIWLMIIIMWGLGFRFRVEGFEGGEDMWTKSLRKHHGFLSHPPLCPGKWWLLWVQNWQLLHTALLLLMLLLLLLLGKGKEKIDKWWLENFFEVDCRHSFSKEWDPFQCYQGSGWQCALSMHTQNKLHDSVWLGGPCVHNRRWRRAWRDGSHHVYPSFMKMSLSLQSQNLVPFL